MEKETASYGSRDGSGFYYTHAAREADAPKDGAYQRIYFHKIGDEPGKDVLALGKDSVRLAQWEIRAGEDGKSVVARMEYGDGGDYDQWLLGPTGKWVQVAAKTDAIKEMRVGPDGALYLLSVKDAPKGASLRTSLASPSLAKSEAIVPEGDSVLEDFLPTKTRIYLQEIVGGVSRVRVVPMAKGKAGAPTPLATPAVSAVNELAALGGDDAAFSTVSYTEPLAWYRVTGKDGFGREDGARKQLQSRLQRRGSDARGMHFEGRHQGSPDGAQGERGDLERQGADDPHRLRRLRDLDMGPRFSPSRLAWLEQGAVVAVANIRGGGEFGEAWHLGGNLTNKQNVFDDFYACAQHLVDAKYTSPQHLAIEGGSNGGLLMGAELVQHPEAFKAVVSHVGIYDMLRVERDPNGAFNTTEYGSVADPKQFDALFAYSPYHHVKDGVAYPAVMFLTGANDPRVSPYHSRKMVARLQAATSSDAPILLRTSANTGHGRGTALPAQIEEATDVDAFLFQQLGVEYTAPK